MSRGVPNKDISYAILKAGRAAGTAGIPACPQRLPEAIKRLCLDWKYLVRVTSWIDLIHWQGQRSTKSHDLYTKHDIESIVVTGK